MNPQQEQELEEILVMARSLLGSMDKVIEGSLSNRVWAFVSYEVYAKQYDNLLNATSKIIRLPDGILYTYDLEALKGPGDTISIHQETVFRNVHGYLSMLCALLSSRLGNKTSGSETRHLEDFLSSKLRPAMLNRKPTSEKDVKNAIEAIMVGRGMQKGADYDRETGRVKYSGKEFVPDFIFRPLSTALEVKLVKESGDDRNVIDEINADIVAYTTAYQHVIFLIYDTGIISNEVEFKRGLESFPSVRVIIVKH